MQMELLALQVYEQYPDTFKESKILSDNVKDRLASLSHNMMFCGLNFGSTPKLAFEPLIIIPIFAFVLSLVQTVLSQYLNKKNNPEMANAGGAEIEALRQKVEAKLGKTVALNIVEVRSPDMNAQLVAENIAAHSSPISRKIWTTSSPSTTTSWWTPSWT